MAGLLKLLREKGIVAVLREAKQSGLVKGIIDGNLLHTKLREFDGAKLKGVDSFGNKYFEKIANTQFGRHRWVEYGDKKTYDASSVPPEWHGWLHYITDHTPEELKNLRPTRYGVEHRPNQTGEGEDVIYHPKGSATNPKQRDWKKYDPWQPS